MTINMSTVFLLFVSKPYVSHMSFSSVAFSPIISWTTNANEDYKIYNLETKSMVKRDGKYF